MQNKEILPFKFETEDAVIECEIIPLSDSRNVSSASSNVELAAIESELSDIDAKIDANLEKIQKLDAEIDRLTNHADSIDVWVSIGSGILAGIIDIFYVGEINIQSTKPKANELVNKFIGKVANATGYSGDRLDGAIKHLENFAPVDQDNIFKQYGISSARLHHLDDLAHHPTPMGLVAALAVTFLKVSIFVGNDGKVHVMRLDGSKEELLKRWLPILISGLLLWLSYVASKKITGEKLSQQPKWAQYIIKMAAAMPATIAIGKVALNWAMHLVSDMGGSKNTPGAGMGIPGFFISLLKEMAMIPPFNSPALHQLISDLYSKEKVDMRYELAGALHLGKQMVPVLINECLVRGFYFVRQLSKQYKLHNGWNGIEWKKTIPFKNRTIARMITISSGVFMAVDLADAAIRSAIKGGTAVTMALNFALRVNFVGVGRFVIALGNDVIMGIKRQKLLRERMQIMSCQIELLSAKTYFRQGKTWVLIKELQKDVDLMIADSAKAISFYLVAIQDIGQSASEISGCLDDADRCNPGLLDDISDMLRY